MRDIADELEAGRSYEVRRYPNATAERMDANADGVIILDGVSFEREVFIVEMTG